MTKTPNSDNKAMNSSDRQESESLSKPRWWRRILLGMTVASLAGIGGGLIYGWFFLENKLTPLVETELTDYLNRPIKIGKFEGLSPNKISFGASEIPATAKDPDRVTTTGVDVAFSLAELIFHRHLNLDVLLKKPSLYIEQDRRKAWVSTKIDSSSGKKKKDLIEVDVKTIQLQDADLELVARSRNDSEGELLSETLNPPVKARLNSLVASFLKRNNTDVIAFHLNGKLIEGGKLQIKGEGFPKTDLIELALQGDDLQAKEIANLLAIPLKFSAGTLDGDLKIKLPDNSEPLINGTATLKQVNARIAELVQPFLNSNGKLEFEDTKIGFKDVNTSFGDVRGAINGELETKGKGYYDLAIQANPTEINRVISTLKLDKPSIPIAGEIKSAIAMTGILNQPQVDFDLLTTKPTRIDRVEFVNINARLRLLGNLLTVKQFTGNPLVGGTVAGNGTIALKGNNDLFFNVRANNVPGNALARSYNNTLPVNVGLVAGNAKFSGKTDSLSTLRAIDGVLNFPLGGGTVAIDKIQYDRGSWQANMKTNNVRLDSLPLDREAAETIGQGFLAGQFKLAGDNNSLSLDTIQANGPATVRIADGTVTTNNLQLNNGRWRSNLQAQGLRLRKIFSDVPVELSNPFSGNFSLNGTTENLALDGISGTGSAQIAALDGLIRASDIKITNGKYSAIVIPDRLRLLKLADIKGLMGGRLNVTGNLDNFRPTAIAANGTVSFSEGINVIDRPLNAKIYWNGKRLEVKETTAIGFLADGFFDVDPSFFTDIPDKLVAINNWQLNVRQARGIDLHKLPLNLPQVVAKTQYTGDVDFRGVLAGTLKVPSVEGDLILNNFSVQEVAFEPMLKGKIVIVPNKSIDLHLKGDRDKLQLGLDAKNQPVSFFVRREQTELSGTRGGDLMRVNTRNLPIAWVKDFAVQNQLGIPETLAAQPIAGELSSNLTFNFKTLALNSDNLLINRPVFGRIKGNLFQGGFEYRDGYFSLQNGKLQLRESEYQVNGELWQTKQGPKYHAEARIVEGRVQDVLEAFQIFELSDFDNPFGDRQYSTAIDLYQPKQSAFSPFAVGGTNCQGKIENSNAPSCPLFATGVPQTSIINQLRRFSEIDALLQIDRKKRQDDSLLPDLSDLNGNFNGAVEIEGSPITGVKANFKFLGNNWQWGKLTANEFVTEGSFINGILTLLPIRIKSDRSLVTFSGSFGGETQSGQLRLDDVPVELLQKFVKLPPEIGLGGRINGTTTIAGSKENPQAKGEITVADGTINQTSIQSTQGSFSYNHSRFEFFASSVVAKNAEPLTITGSIPYKFNFAAVEPDSDRLNLNLNIKNEGLQLLNVLSRGEVRWLKGQGNVNLDIEGEFDRQHNRPKNLSADGKAVIENATLEARTLPKAPLTQVNGNIRFNLNGMTVDHLQGNFGGGQISAKGSLALDKPIVIAPEDILTVNFNDIAVNLKGLYQGGVQGELKLTGSAIEPDIAGNLNLFDGSILLGETTETTKTDNSERIEDNPDRSLAAATEFNQLNINLDRNIQIIKPPILNFLAQGNLKLKGTFNRPLPEGTIKLKRGQVNIFTTQLNLASDEKNSAKFSKNKGLDPYLDVNLVGSALETSRSAFSEDTSLTEINDVPISRLGSLQTVRVQAKVKGFASQVTNNIELSSSPPRTKTEIISLLGGSFVNTLGRGDSTLGLANLAGSAFFGTFNSAISDAFGLSEFRLFPTQLIDDRKERETILGLAAEVGIDVTKSLSVSVLKILNTEIPAQYGVRYRLNNNFSLRGSSNFDNDSRAIFEYEQRF
jgi:translocation and assembly module TamB